MNWWHDFADQIEPDAPLGSLTWFKLGGRARWLFRPADADALATLFVRARDHGVPVKVLGGGANVLVRDGGFDGLVVRLDGEAFRTIDGPCGALRVGAGVDLMPLSRQCSDKGFTGLECMAGIPGSVGGAVKMNAGGRFGDFGSSVCEVEVLDERGLLATWARDRVGFGYRRSELGERIIVSALIELREDDPARAKERYDEYFEYKRRSQPMADNSAGCIFKNPPGASAGALIDRAGLKGTRCGGATVSTRHANFIIADRGAVASDVLRVVDMVRDGVRRAFNTELEMEIDVW